MSGFREEVQIYIKYNCKKPKCNRNSNVDLVKYLDYNIDVLNTHGTFVDIKLVDELDNANLTRLVQDHKIKNLPALVSRNRPGQRVYGPKQIKEFLKKMCGNKMRISLNNPSEEIREFQNELMMNTYDDDEEKSNLMADNIAMATVMTQKRKEEFNNANSRNAQQRKEHRNSMRQQPGRPQVESLFSNRDTGYYGDRQHDNRRYEGRQHGGGQYDNQNVQRENNVEFRDNPAEIQRSMGGRNVSKDDDLMSKFWESRTETKM
jgi:hypothetical protein